VHLSAAQIAFTTESNCLATAAPIARLIFGTYSPCKTNQNNLKEIKQLLSTQDTFHTTVPKDIQNYAAQETHDSVAEIVKNLGGGPSATNKAMFDRL
jgi:hypothetical protein